MVIVQRRTRPQDPADGFQLPYADGNSPMNESPSRSGRFGGFGARRGGGGVASKWSPGNSFSFDLNRSTTTTTTSPLYKWLIRLFCVLGVASCLTAYRASSRAAELADKLEGQQYALRVQGEDTLATLKDAREGLKTVREYNDALKQTQEALYHEIRMVNEMFEAESTAEMPSSPRRGSPDKLVESWMDHRQVALKHKINNLQEFVQQESRDQVIARYGHGPYRVKFTVQLDQDDFERSFVVEMAPLELMPHSVHMFLDTVRLKLWQNTIFWHHDEIKHVVAGALISYKTGEPKYHHLRALGWDGLLFAEHSEQYPHNKYTMGFSGKGPNIYVNLHDNQNIHGPGGPRLQQHDMPDDADPCFATVVEGFDVIDALQKVMDGKETMNTNGGREKIWDENEKTRIINVEMVQ